MGKCMVNKINFTADGNNLFLIVSYSMKGHSGMLLMVRMTLQMFKGLGHQEELQNQAT